MNIILKIIFILFFSPNPISSPPSSQHNEPIYKTKPTRNKTLDYYLNHSTQQQPIYIGQRYEIINSINQIYLFIYLFIYSLVHLWICLQDTMILRIVQQQI